MVEATTQPLGDCIYIIHWQSSGGNPRKEIAMEKLRLNISVELHEEDLKKIMFKVGKDGIDLSTLITGFIGDLVASDYSRNGSDEVDRANSYYDCCWYGINNEDTFLYYLIENYEIEDYINILDDIEGNKEWIADGGERFKELEEAKKSLNGYYEEYAKKYSGKVLQDRDTAVRFVSKWYENYINFIYNCESIDEE